jgi:hypothetical protein
VMIVTLTTIELYLLMHGVKPSSFSLFGGHGGAIFKTDRSLDLISFTTDAAHMAIRLVRHHCLTQILARGVVDFHVSSRTV